MDLDLDEVLKITSQASEGKAYVQFATRSAAEKAVQLPVLERPEIQVATRRNCHHRHTHNIIRL